MMIKRSLATVIALTISTSSFAAANNSSEVQADSTMLVPAETQVTGELSNDPQQRIQQLSYMAQDQSQSIQNRTGALRALGAYPSQNALVAVARGLKDSNSEVREAAVIGAAPYPFEHRWTLISPLLNDESKMVQHSAASNLVRDYSVMTQEQKAKLDQPVTSLIEFLEQQTTQEYQLLLADVLRWSGEPEKAETIYIELVKTRTADSQVWLSFADNYRAQGKDKEAVSILDRGLEKLPDNAALHYSKSLTLVRLEDKNAAAVEIEKAAHLAENNSYYWYLNGVLQEPLSIDKSTKSFEKAYMISGSPEQLYAVCDIYVRYGNDKSDECLTELSKVAPDYVIKQLEEKRIDPS
jgi:tetratricopeptide (TPR) repeat protein